MSTILKALEQLESGNNETPAHPPEPGQEGDPMASAEVMMPMMRRRHRRRPIWLGTGLFVAGVSLLGAGLFWSGGASEPTLANAPLPPAVPAIAAVAALDPDAGRPPSPSPPASDTSIQPWYPEGEVSVQPSVAATDGDEVEIPDDLSDDQWAMLMLEEDPSAIGIGAPDPEPDFAVVERAPEPAVPVAVASRIEQLLKTPEPPPVERRQPAPRGTETRRTAAPAPEPSALVVPVAKQVEPPPAPEPEVVIAPAPKPRPRRAEPVLDEAARAVAGMQPPEELAIEPEAAPEPIQRRQPSREPAVADAEAILDSAPGMSAAPAEPEVSSLAEAAPPSPVAPIAPPAPSEPVARVEAVTPSPPAPEVVAPSPPADEPVVARKVEAVIDAPVARGELAAPPLRLASTSWHPKPERREAELAIDDMQRFVREGDQTLGYTVQEITPSSVVFSKDGETVRVGVGRR